MARINNHKLGKMTFANLRFSVMNRLQLHLVNRRMANNARCLEPILDRMQWLPVVALQPLGLIALVEVDGVAASAIAGLDVI